MADAGKYRAACSFCEEKNITEEKTRTLSKFNRHLSKMHPENRVDGVSKVTLTDDNVVGCKVTMMLSSKVTQRMIPGCLVKLLFVINFTNVCP